MIKNYFKIAIRNLWKNKVFTSLNIVGLTIAFGVAILLTIYGVFQLSFDRFHENGNSIYQVYSEDSSINGLESNTSKSEPFAAALQDEVLGVEKITRHAGSGILISYEDKQLRMNVSYVDPDFFDMFSFPIIKGDTQHPITSESSIAITEHTANRIFGQQNPIGKTITVLRDEKQIPFNITAVVKDFPNTSSMGFDVIMNFKSQGKNDYERVVGKWDMENHEVYMQLSEGITPIKFEESTKGFTELHYKEEIDNAKRDGVQPNKNGGFKQIKLLSFLDIKFANFNKGAVTVNRTMPYLVIGIAFLIL